MATGVTDPPAPKPLQTQSAAGRGERLFPPRSSRVHWILTQLRIELESISREFGTSSALRLVDFGCGNMPYRPLFEGCFAEYIGCDLVGNEMADRVMEAPNRLPVDPESADVVLSSQVLEHVSYPDEYLAEACRVLASGGTLILSTHGVWRYHPDPCDFWRWTCQGLQRQIESAGFNIVRFRGVLGPEATALQLWQDAVLGRVPRLFRKCFTAYMQWRIRRADERCPASSRNSDACVWVVVARKR